MNPILPYGYRQRRDVRNLFRSQKSALGSTEPESTKVLVNLIAATRVSPAGIGRKASDTVIAGRANARPAATPSRRPAGPVAGLTLSRDDLPDYAAPMTAAIPGAVGAAALLGDEQ